MPLSDQDVAVAVDHSDDALEAARYAAGLARLVGRPLVLLHVFEGHPDELLELDRLPEEFEGVIHLSDREIREASEHSSRRLFDRIRAQLDKEPVDTREVTLLGDPAEALLEYTRRSPDTLLVMGRRGKSRIKAAFLGSVSDHLVRQAGCPVLITH